MAGLFGWLFRYGVLVFFLVGLACIFGGLKVYRHFASELPNFNEVSNYAGQAPGITRIYANDGVLISEIAREHRAYAPLDSVPTDLRAAFLAAEDRRFEDHHGLDFRGLARAMVANYRSGTIRQGGSTITQQVAKSFLANSEQTLARKIREAILALRIDSRLSKDAILEIYLNKIFLGHGAYGVRSAASRYFNKDLDELTLAESALIAGMARAPSYYNPVASEKRAIHRRAIVLQDMVEADLITKSARDTATSETLVLATRRDNFRWRAPAYAEQARREVIKSLGEESVLHDGLIIETAAQLELQRLAEASILRATRKLDHRHGYRGPVAHLDQEESREIFLSRSHDLYGSGPLEEKGRWYLALVNSLDRSTAQLHVGSIEVALPLRNAVWAGAYDRYTGISGHITHDLRTVLEAGDVVWVRSVPAPSLTRRPASKATEERIPTVRLEQRPLVEAALFTFDHVTGYVEAMGAGLDYDRSQYNRTTQACRSPGSVIKAFYYGLALDLGDWQMDSILEAKPWEPEPGEEWNPRNIDKTVDGKVLLRTALIKSLNTPSIRLFLAIGAERVVAWTRKLGITTKLIADKGLSLGTSCMQMDELSRAFGTYARGGSRQDPVYIRRVVDKNGKLRLDRRHPHDGAMDVAGRIDRMAALAIHPPKQIIDERSVFLISRLLREVVTAGIGGRASRAKVPVAGKSGSASGRYKRQGQWSDLTTDTWFIGFTSRHVTAAWLGFDDRNERSLGDEEASYTTATPLWADFMKSFVGDIPHGPVPREQPPGLSMKIVDATHGGEPIEGLPQARIYFKQGSRSSR